MNIKEIIKESRFVVWTRLMIENAMESFQISKHIGSSHQSKDLNKKQAELQIRTHALEKGMSIGDVKKGFGKTKAIALIHDLDDFISKGGDRSFANDTASVIAKYIQFNEEQCSDMSNIKSLLEKIISSHNLQIEEHGGVVILNLNDTKEKTKSVFSTFCQSRYSIRDFGKNPLNIDDVRSAIKLCEKTPSACNRQSWRIHIFTDPQLRNRLFDLQGGCNGFSRDMQCAILICADMRCYGFYEKNLPFVDGGLYAMNLLYALHSKNIATIPLTMGIKAKRVNALKKELRIPANEMPILLIGVGTFKDEYKVAVSKRDEIGKYVTLNHETNSL